MTSKIFCPRCKTNQEYYELDEGPDGYDDDITFTSEVCKVCELYHYGWSDGGWYEEGTTWTDVDYDLKPLFTEEQAEELEKKHDI